MRKEITMRKIGLKPYSILPFFLLIGLAANAQINKPEATSRIAATAVAVPEAYTLPTVNYVRTWSPRLPLTDSSQVISGSRTIREVTQSTQYFDGLGRPLQTVQKGVSEKGRDIVVPYVFDEFGRDQFQYLPYTPQSGNVNDGKFKTDAFTGQASFYRNAALNPTLEGDHIYYSRKEFEQSPLNRALKVYHPGDSWADKPVEMQYKVNLPTDSVLMWKMVAQLPSAASYYPAGRLFKTITINENGNKEIEFKDTDNRLILRKVQLAEVPGTGHVGWLCSYSVYDDIGNLRFVISPRACEAAMINKWGMTTTIADELCFQYQYDERNRLVIKKVPGVGSISCVYDNEDRLVFTQDAMQRAKSPMEWHATFYDALGRPVMTAIYTGDYTRDALQTAINGAAASGTVTQFVPAKADISLYTYDGSPAYKATNSIVMLDGFESGDKADFIAEIDPGAGETVILPVNKPLPGIDMSALTPLSYTYYDNYNFPGKHNFQKNDLSMPQAADTLYPLTMPASYSTTIQGKTTGSKIRILGTNKWLTVTSYYNDKGWPIQVITDNHLGGTDVRTTLYNFKGIVLSTYLRHQNPKSITPATSVLTTMVFDHAERLISVRKRLNGDATQERTISLNSYDELGRLRLKRLGVKNTGAMLDTLNYTYNLMGWIQSINHNFVNTDNSTSNWFGLQLSYDYGFTKNQYNGNISGIKWKGRTDQPSAYGYSYDRSDRLIAADFTQQSSGTWSLGAKDFSVSNITYDVNGNLLTMNQKGLVGTSSPLIDQMAYAYFPNTNKLRSVTDATSESTRNAGLGDFLDGSNGGTDDYAYDLNGNLTQDLNKNITKVTYNHLNLPTTILVKNKGAISYSYDAGGEKLSKIVVDSTVSPARITVTDYAEEFVYSRDSIRYISHEEGRIRPVYKTGSPITYVYDYFEKDHVGNVRTVLTDQTDFAMYTATMETAAAPVEAALFSNVEETRIAKPVGYPEDKTTDNNKSVAVLSAKTGGKKIGPSIVLRVMAGDTVRINAKAFYKSGAPENNKATAPMEDMLAGLLSVFGPSGAENTAHGMASATQTGPFTSDFYANQYQRLKERDNDANQSNRPKAYLNFVLFDNDFKMVDNNSGVRQVKTTPDELQELQVDQMTVSKTGYLYVYTSNESQQDVFFDNIILGVNSGPLVEETHYYPFGLVMEGISSNALKGTAYPANKIRFASKELQDGEFSDGSGLDNYDFTARNYNAQIGRWHSADPLADKYQHLSPYNYVANNPVKYLDPDGRLIKDKDGNIIIFSTGRIVDWGYMPIRINKILSSGNISAMSIRREYEVVYMFADNGTPIEAHRLVREYVSDDILQETPRGLVSTYFYKNYPKDTKYECVSDCHGYTFSDSKLWINDDQVQAILDNDNIYECDVPESMADIVIYRKKDKDGNWVIVHSARKNPDGTYNADAGVLSLICDVTLEEATQGIPIEFADSKSVLFVKRRASEAVFNTNFGTVNNGVRTITDKAQINEILKIIKGS